MKRKEPEGVQEKVRREEQGKVGTGNTRGRRTGSMEIQEAGDMKMKENGNLSIGKTETEEEAGKKAQGKV